MRLSYTWGRVSFSREASSDDGPNRRTKPPVFGEAGDDQADSAVNSFTSVDFSLSFSAVATAWAADVTLVTDWGGGAQGDGGRLIGASSDSLTVSSSFTGIASMDGGAMNAFTGVYHAGIFGDGALTDGPMFSGLVGTGGSIALLANSLRSTFGIDGTGVKIGILSDSYNVRGGAAADIARGDLPAAGVQVLEEGIPSGPSMGNDEGRAMAELIHQIAPGASLAFYSADWSESDFANGITALKNAGCNIIVDDVTYYDEPFFLNGLVAQAVNAAAAAGVACFSSAGNDASNAYQAAYSPMSAVLPNGLAVSDTQNFGGGSALQSITMGYGDFFVLQWDQAWGQASTNMDVRFYQGGTLVATATRFNSGEFSNPIVGFRNNTGVTQTYQIAITNDGGANPGLVKYVLYGNGRPATINNFATNSGTLVGHHDATGEVAVGAAYYGSPSTLESFSSTGPAQILFDDAGNRLATPITTSIGVTGVDGIATSLPAGSGLNPFYGTSAAAPTVAALAALLEQAAPGATNTTIAAAIENTATDIGAAGVDNATGHGLANGLAAGNSIATPHVYVGAANIGDSIYPGTGTNTVTGGSGDDYIYITVPSSNTINGGGGENTIDYSAAPSGLAVNLVGGITSNGFAGADTLTNIQVVKGSAFNDTFYAGSAPFQIDGEGGTNKLDFLGTSNPISISFVNSISSLGSSFLYGNAYISAGAQGLVEGYFYHIQNIVGGAGDDSFNMSSSLNTGPGSFSIDGGGGTNSVSFADQYTWTVNLSLRTAVAGGVDPAYAQYVVPDYFTNIQNFAFVGVARADTVIGGYGNHTITGGQYGALTLDYSAAPGSVIVNFATGIASNGFGGTDQFSGVVFVKGGPAFDTFIGGPGNHQIFGNGGINTVDYSAATSGIFGNLDNGVTNGFNGFDSLHDIQNIKLSPHGGTITGSAANNTFVVEGGNNTIDGGSGTDTVDYSVSTGAVNVNLATGVVSNGFGGTDTLTNIEIVKGSTHGGSETGSSANDTFMITGGNNIVNGGGGTNTVDYSWALGAVTVNLLTGVASNGFGGTDTLSNIETVVGSVYGDTLTAGTGGSTLAGGAGVDTFNVASGDGHDVITDFQAGAGGDQLKLTTSSPVQIISVNYLIASDFAGDSGGTTGGAGWVVLGNGDFTGDGKKDFVLQNTSTGALTDEVWNGSGYTTVNVGSTNSTFLGFGDFQGGGRTGLLWRAADGTTSSWLGNADGTFTPMNLGTTTGWSFIGTGDYTGDGKTDVLLRYVDNSTTAVWISSGNGAFTGKVVQSTAGMNIIATGSLAGNGRSDLLWRATDGTTTAWVANGDGSFNTVNLGQTGAWSFIGTGDYTGDGKTDMLLRFSDNSTTAIWISNGTGSFTGKVVQSSAGLTLLTSGDFNGDGRSDILWRASDTTTSVWLGDSDGSFTSASMGQVGTNWNVMSTGDLNGDGKADVTWRNTDGRTGIWYMNGTSLLDATQIANAVSSGNSSAYTTITYGTGDSIDLLGVQASSLLASQIVTQANLIQGGAGNDTFIGAAGSHSYDGGGGTNTLDYSAAPGAVTVNFSTNTASNGFGGTDSFVNVQAFIGSANSDSFIGGAGNHTINGSGGTDTLDYSAASGAVSVNLGAGTASNGLGGTDSFSNIEAFKGGSGNDTFIAGAGSHSFDGGAGTNTLDYSAGSGAITANLGTSSIANGFGGTDTYSNIQVIKGSSGNDSFIGGAGNHTIDGGAGINTLDYSAATGAIIVSLPVGLAWFNSSSEDIFSNIQVFKGGAGNDTFFGGSGNHTFNGGAGSNTVSYVAASGAVNVNLLTGTASNGFGGTDTLSNFQTVVGSVYNDTITAGTGGETLTGGIGADTFNVASGDGHDIITDFQAGAGGDHLNLTSSGSIQITAANYLIASDFAGDSGGTTGGAGWTVLGNGDFTGDGKKDFVLQNTSTGALTDEVWNGSGYTTVNVGSTNSTFLGFGDFQGGGRTGLLWRAADGTTSSWLGNADGTFTPMNLGTTAGWSFIGTGDYTGDGKTDVLLRYVDGSTTAVWISNGNGAFTGKVVQSTAGMNIIATGSLAGNGRSDLLWRATDGTTTAWVANGDGSFNTVNLGQTGAWSFIGTGDYTGDGKTDMLLRFSDNSTTAIWISNGTGSFTGKVVQSSAGLTLLTSGDFNGDGRSDILWRASDTTTSVWLGNSDGSFTSASMGQVGTNWNVMSTGDLNGDGKADVTWRNDDGRTGIWYMNGTSLLDATQIANAVSSGSGAAYTTITYGNGDSVDLLGVAPSALTSGQITATIQGTSGADTFTGSAANEIITGSGGSDVYQFGRGGGQDQIVNGLAGNSGATGELDFNSGIATNQLWLLRSGNDLQIDVMGTTDHVTVAGWYSSATAQLQEIKTADGSMIDTQLNALVQAMATYSSAHAGFDPTAAANSSAPNDSTLLTAIATDWHH